ncbi:hypothetical protein [Streptomyces sp. 4F14]|uniref:hypothetical protein n=1 Tax=Streptomyces sp. 4F14 TaxID=3394380 RepID=UPI003A8ADCD8
MTSTAGPEGRYRLGRIGASLLLLIPLLTLTAASGQGSAEPGAGVTAAGDTRIAYAGTKHRSLGDVTGATTSTPVFGTGATHYDTQPNALGDQLVFTSLRDEKTPQVYLRAADGSVHRLTTGMNAAHPRLTPDGKSVVFDAGTTQRDLWRIGTDGKGLTQLTDSTANETYPTVSPDSTRIAYASDANPLVGQQIYVRQLSGGTATMVTSPANGTASEPAWNPVNDDANRDWIAYTATTDGVGRLRVVNGNGGGDETLLAGNYAQWRGHSVAWKPDGNGVIFLSPEITCDCEGNRDHLFATEAHSGTEPDVLNQEDRELRTPTWFGPLDGGHAILEHTTGTTANAVTLQDIRSDGVDPRDLNVPILNEDPAADTNTDPTKDPLFQPGANFDPWTERQNYTPDGRRLVVTRFEGDPGSRVERIWTVDADGTNPQPMRLGGRESADWDTDPTFSPDGKSLAFTRTSPGGLGQPSRILVADVASGNITGQIVPPEGELTGRDAQPTWSSDGKTLAFTRSEVIGDSGGNKHIWTVPVNDLARQEDLSLKACPGTCQVIDDSPAFSPDGLSIVFNRKNGGGAVDERNGLLLTSLSGTGCKVLLPAGAPGCSTQLPDTTVSGPHQPRDAAWTADGKSLVFSSRETVAPNSPEKLRTLDIATGEVTALTAQLDGRQKEPSVQQSVDLAVKAPDTVPTVTVGTSTTIGVDLVNNGPAASPGTTLTITPPSGVQITGLTFPGGTCTAASLQCDVGVVPPGETVRVTVTVTGVTVGDAPIGWNVTGTVLDPQPTDNTGRTVVPVGEEPPPSPTPTPTPTPTPSPTPPASPTPRPTPPPTSPPAPAPQAGPGLSLTAQPNPGYVGGRVVVTYTVRNGRNALATGLRLKIGLPANIPNNGPPAGCDASWSCALPDLAQGASTVVQVVLSPDKAATAQLTGTLTTTGTDADRGDNTARQRLRILQPKIVAVPEIGKPGFVTSVRGTDFPPGTPVKFTWKPGITAAAAPTIPLADGTFIGQLLILAKDQTGPRIITASGPGFSPVTTDFLVVLGTIQPPDEVTRR